MHRSVMNWLGKSLSANEVGGARILEVGSMDVNGSPRSVILPLKPAQYVGVDGQAGKGVDKVLDASILTSAFPPGSFDIVVCTEMLEHVKDWRSVVVQLKRSVRTGGLLVVTTRSPGFPYHPYPVDLWRYTTWDFQKIFSDTEILELSPDPQMPGVFLKARKPDGFRENDLSLIEARRMVPPPGR